MTPIRIGFVCIENAGRSQIAAAFAREMARKRGVADAVEIHSGGTRPANRIHPVVIETMAEVGIDLSGATPSGISAAQVTELDYVITMGCSAEDVCPATWQGDSRDWDLDDPTDRPLPEVRRIREQVWDRVTSLLDELAGKGDSLA
ncbi:MAG: low molecular weight phosphatase family protein [Halodesulfurarchaeum sp.]